MKARHLFFLTVLALTAAVSACAPWAPRLHVVWVEKVPDPNGRIETLLWARAPSLDLKLRQRASGQRDVRRLNLRAIHDGRAISFLVQWPDETDTAQFSLWTVNGKQERMELVSPRMWIWNEERRDYFVQELPADRLAFLWPLAGAGASRFDLFEAREAVYDVWEWTAGWTELSAYARDARLKIVPHGKDADPGAAQGPLYEARGGGRVEHLWIEDAGTPGTIATPKPRRFDLVRMPGAEAQDARGSAADVMAFGVYNPAVNRREGYWFVEFHRLLTTGAADEDYQLQGAGPHPFALILTDNKTPGASFASPKINMTIEPAPAGKAWRR